MDNTAPVILDIESTTLNDEDRELIGHPAVGGLILFTRNYESRVQLRELIAQLRSLKPGLLICVDHEGGRVQRFREGFTRLPPMQSLGKLYEQDKARAREAASLLGWLMAAELLAFDIDISFAPVLDLDQDFSSIIGDRAFSERADTATVLAESFIAGMQSAGMCATGKHFPGHGAVKEDSHLELPVDRRTYSEIECRDLLPFGKLMAKLQGLMPAHIVFSAIDSQPVGFSKVWIQDLLKTTMGFKGVVFSDDLSMEGAAFYPRFVERAQAALGAGCDAILVCNNRRGAIETVEYVEGIRAQLRCRPLDSMKTSQAREEIQALQTDVRYDAAQKFVEFLHVMGGS